MSSHVPVSLRRQVRGRARGLCEYCLVHEEDTYFGCQIEHVVSEKHGGRTIASNLAWACANCNWHKGTDIATVVRGSSGLVRLFNPRVDSWRMHFRHQGAKILGITDVGRATVQLLQLNSPARLAERRYLMLLKRYP